jgi:hypothetical protein
MLPFVSRRREARWKESVALTALLLIAAAGVCMLGAHGSVEHHAGPDLCLIMMVVAAVTMTTVLSLVPSGSASPFIAVAPVASFPRALDPPPKRPFGF